MKLEVCLNGECGTIETGIVEMLECTSPLVLFLLENMSGNLRALFQVETEKDLKEVAESLNAPYDMKRLETIEETLNVQLGKHQEPEITLNGYYTDRSVKELEFVVTRELVLTETEKRILFDAVTKVLQDEYELF